jgi:CHAT domain-containing protein
LHRGVKHRRFSRRGPAAVVAVGVLAVGWLLSATPVSGQLQGQNSPLPRQEYYLVFEQFNRGEFRAAQRNLRSFSRGATILVNGRFLDSVCYWTILGESHFRLGEYALAIEQYEAALDLYLNLQEWPARTQFPVISEDQAATRNAMVPWAVSKRAPRYGAFNRRMLVRLGKTPAENEDALRRGGVVDPERLQGVDLAESMRCVALALYRRHMIKGPIASIDPFTRRLTTTLAGNGGTTIPAAWTGIAKGLAFASQGENNRANQLLTSSLQIGGLDHPLTPIGLLALGQLAVDAGRLSEAEDLFLEASIAAAAFQQYDIVAESLRAGAVLHAAKRTLQPWPPLVAALDWARRENKETLQASLLTSAAMLAAESGDAGSARSLLQRARSEMSRNDLRRSRIYMDWLYTNALLAFLEGDRSTGFGQFAEFLEAARTSSFWLFQLALADVAVTDGGVTDRESELLYDMLLREPTDADWRFRPEETMAFLATPHYEPMERWFQVALTRKAEEKAIGIAELIRRQRFFSALPMGGRLLALRWILNAPQAALSATARQQKETLLLRYPDYKALSDQGEALRQQLALLPVAPDKDSDEYLQQSELMKSLGRIVGEQEKNLRIMALIRDPAELAFPQPLSIPEIQQRLQPGQIIVSFLRAGQLYYVMKLSRERYTIEGQIQARAFEQKIMQLTRALQVGEKSAVHAPEVFLDDQWRQLATEISAMIFARTQPQAIEELEEIVFVPDGKAWYLPMEILQLGTAGASVNLNKKVRVRYAPLAALGVPDERTSSRFRRSAVVVDRNFLRDDEARMAQGLADLNAAIPEIVTLNQNLAGPSALLAATLDQLIVWHLSSEKTRNAFDFSPLQFDEDRSGSDLRSWMMLPWQGVDRMILSGVSSSIEGSSRSRADGAELFLASTALMASGTRTLLISRWRVGGQSCLDLTREFAMQLGKQSAARAWQRSLDLFTQSELDQAAEPRIQEKLLDQPLKGEHPFFWAGYMLVDNGHEPQREEETPQPPAGQAEGDQ